MIGHAERRVGSLSTRIDYSVLQRLENNIGKRVQIIVDQNYGFGGVITTISQNPPGLWLSNAESIVLRTTLANPLPQVVRREEVSKIFVNMRSAEHIVILFQGEQS